MSNKTNKTKAPTETSDEKLHSVMLEAIEQQGDAEEVKLAGAAVSDHLKTVALLFKGNVGTAPNGRKEFKAEAGDPMGTGFLGACYKQEQWAKSADAKDSKGIKCTVEAIPNCWKYAKSHIRAAMANGVDLNQSLTKIKEENAKVNKAAKGEGHEGDADISEANVNDSTALLMSINDLFDKLDDTGKDDLITDLMAVRVKYSDILKAVVPVEPVEGAGHNVDDAQVQTH